MFDYRGRTALITGASSGIGEAFAHALAARGMHLILVARSEERLRALAQELAQRHAIRAEALPADLSSPDAAAAIQAEVQARGLSVDQLINNAGFGTYGNFETLDPRRDHEEIMVNVVAVVGLLHAFLPAMAARGEGAVINVASLAGFQPTPYMAVYGASKAFVRALSEALWQEYHGRGIRVLALCPGPVKTSFFVGAGSEEIARGLMLTPERVVASALRALERGRISVVPGWSNALIGHLLTRLGPRRVVMSITARLLRPRKEKAVLQSREDDLPPPLPAR